MIAADLMKTAAQRLVGLSTTPQLDAEVLLAHVLGLPRADALLHLDQEVPAADFEALLARRIKGEPIAYLTGHQEFWGRDFIVTPDVLIPRPDSETLISTTIEVLDRSSLPRPRLLELGTGSGCLGLTLLAERPTLTAKLTDISPAALAVARRNAAALGLTDRVELKTQDLLNGEAGRYDILIGNLPYVPSFWLAASEQAPETRGLPFEPPVALTGGSDGFDLLRRFLIQFRQAPPAPILILEHGDDQQDELSAIVVAALPDAKIERKKDLAGRPRVLVIDAAL